jgi:hypothetical protein
MLHHTVSTLNKTGGFENMQNYNPIHTLRTYSEKPKLFMSKRNLKGRNLSVGGPLNETEKRLGQTLNNFDVKPKLLESKIRSNTDFFNISDGFKKVFAHGDKKDQKLIIPISGYGGHRRGDRSQNFFGKSFRETSLQSKKLQRDLTQPKSPME